MKAKIGCHNVIIILLVFLNGGRVYCILLPRGVEGNFEIWPLAFAFMHAPNIYKHIQWWKQMLRGATLRELAVMNNWWMHIRMDKVIC